MSKWVYEINRYDNPGLAEYVCACIRDDWMMRGRRVKTQVVRLRRRKIYVVRFSFVES